MPDTPVVGLLATPQRVVVLAPVWQLFDAATLIPVAEFDAAALTSVRTAAVSAPSGSSTFDSHRPLRRPGCATGCALSNSKASKWLV